MNILFFLIPKSQVAFLYDTSSMRQGLEKMRAHGYTAIPVITEEGTYCGTVSDGDFLWKMVDCNKTELRELEKLSVKDLLRDNWNPAVRVTASMEELLDRSMRQNFVPVVDDRNVFIGIITRKDIIHYLVEQERQRNPEPENAGKTDRRIIKKHWKRSPSGI